MSDLEYYLVNASGYEPKFIRAYGTHTDQWTLAYQCPTDKRLAIVHVTMIFHTVGTNGGASLCLSDQATHATVAADTNKKIIVDPVESPVVLNNGSMNFEGCPVIGLKNQSIWIMTEASADGESDCHFAIGYLIL